MLKIARRKNGGNQGEPTFQWERLAEKIDSKGWSLGYLETQSGVSKSQISLMSRNERPNVSAAILAKLAIALGCTVDYLLGLTDDPRPPAESTEKQMILAALSDEEVDSVRIYASLPVGDREIVDSVIKRLDSRARGELQ